MELSGVGSRQALIATLSETTLVDSDYLTPRGRHRVPVDFLATRASDHVLGPIEGDGVSLGSLRGIFLDTLVRKMHFALNQGAPVLGMSYPVESSNQTVSRRDCRWIPRNQPPHIVEA